MIVILYFGEAAQPSTGAFGGLRHRPRDEAEWDREASPKGDFGAGADGVPPSEWKKAEA